MIASRTDDNHFDTIQGLWIGSELTVMERLSISSFLANGHPFHLYVYSDVQGLPAGAKLRDANEILPSSDIFQYRNNGSYAGFANQFRYELLSRRGGWWVDLDTICLRPFAFEREYVFGAEPVAAGGTHPASCVLKAPANSPVMTHLSQACRAKDREAIAWGETGPRLVAEAIGRFVLQSHLERSDVFCPIGWYEWQRALDPEFSILFDTRTCAVHLWNEVWRRNGKDKDAQYHPDCLYELLKAKYL